MRGWRTAVAVGIATALAAGQAPATGATTSTPVADMLGQLVTAAPVDTGYRASAFGGWADLDKDGCSDRTEVLMKEARGATPSGCSITGLVWTDPWTGSTVRSSSEMTVERLVPLAELWRSGAWWYSTEVRTRLANERAYGATLQAVSRTASRTRDGRSPEAWLPTQARRCSYVANWIGVKWRWRLTVDTAERAALAKAVKACGSPSMSTPKRAISAAPPSDPLFDTCEELAASKLGPYRRGERSEYEWYRDDDRDGIACEEQEGLEIQGSHDWRTERHVATLTPTIVARAMQLPDRTSFVHARILRGSEEIWRAVGFPAYAPTSPEDAREDWVAETVPAAVLTEGLFTVQYWVATTSSTSELPTAQAISSTFRVDVTPPQRPTTLRSCMDGYCSARTDDPQVVAIRFYFNGGYYADVKPAANGEASYALPYMSGPQLPITAHAIDRAGNLSLAGSRG